MIPPKESARFVWRMEEVLDLYEEPYDPKRPVVCFDERPCQLLAEVREPLPLTAGRPQRRDHEYQRRGMAHLFVAFEPLTGWRDVEVRERRRGCEFAEFVRHLAEDLYPEEQSYTDSIHLLSVDGGLGAEGFRDQSVGAYPETLARCMTALQRARVPRSDFACQLPSTRSFR